MIFILIGCPGAGKGTQSALLESHFDIPHLSTGEMLRAAKASGSELGRQVAPILDSGRLVGDELMIGVVAEKIATPECKNGFLLDGFPRTVPQAEALDNLLQSRSRQIDAAIELRVPEEELFKRILNRAEEAEHPRPEDSPDSIVKRLAIYAQKTAPILNYYRAQKRLVSIDGLGGPQTVFESILEQIPHQCDSSSRPDC